MTHIRDKTVSDLITDFNTLKINEACKVIGTVVAVLTLIGGITYYLGSLKSEINAVQCSQILERRTKLLKEVTQDANWDVTNKINQELQ